MTQLCRNSLKTFLSPNVLKTPNAGLLLTRGMAEDKCRENDTKKQHIKSITALNPSPLYQQAYQQWRRVAADASRFVCKEMNVIGRLYIGVQRDNAVEAGISTSHVYGMPMIPGSACKGLARAIAERLGMDKRSKIAYEWTFGTDGDDGEAGGLIFHDAWWIPEGKPFVAEIITPHHQEYYATEGEVEATDFDAPIPASQIATQGSFYFVVEGDESWASIGLDLLVKGLKEMGVGAKTSSGYGFFKE